MPCTPLGTLTIFYSLCKPASGETGWAAAINGNWDIIDSTLNSLVSVTPRSYLAGLEMINNGRTSIDVQPGFAIASDQSTQMSLTSVLTKNLGSSWAVGSGNGGLFSGSATASTWYHVFLIKRTDTNVVDAGFDTSVVAANIPANYTAFRRIGSVRTASTSSDIYKFNQNGDLFTWQLSSIDSNVGTPGTSANTRTVTVPTGVLVEAIFNFQCVSAATNAVVDVSSLVQTDTAPVGGGSPSLQSRFGVCQAANTASGFFFNRLRILTNTSGQIRTRWSASGGDNVELISTIGYVDRRGRDV